MTAWGVKIVNILALFWFALRTCLTNAERVEGKVTTLSDHEKKPYAGKHRDPHQGRRKRKEKPDPQVYDYGIVEVTEAIEAERRANGK